MRANGLCVRMGRHMTLIMWYVNMLDDMSLENLKTCDGLMLIMCAVLFPGCCVCSHNVLQCCVALYRCVVLGATSSFHLFNTIKQHPCTGVQTLFLLLRTSTSCFVFFHSDFAEWPRCLQRGCLGDDECKWSTPTDGHWAVNHLCRRDQLRVRFNKWMYRKCYF